MANIVKFEDGGWDVREFGDGVRRVSGSEIGKRLRYNVKKPSSFNKMVIEKWAKEGKLNDHDMVQKLGPCKRGFGAAKKYEYWLSFAAALRVAMEVQTNAAKEVRQRVIDYLQKQAELAALPAVVEPSTQAIVATVERFLERHTEAMTQLVMTAMKATHGLYIDEDRRAELLYIARLIVNASVQKTSMKDVWEGTRESPNNRFRPGNLFATVWHEKFTPVRASLIEQLKFAEKVRRLKEEEDKLAKELAEKELAEKARVEAEKAAEAQKMDNVRPITWKKRS